MSESGGEVSAADKPKLSIVPLAGLYRMACVMWRGIRDGRSVGDWQKMSKEDFVEARLRHITQVSLGDTSEDHEASIAVNSMIILWFEQKELAQHARATLINKPVRNRSGKGSGCL